MAERNFSTDQSRTENTLSTNRQSDLEMEYKYDFRDGARVDAIDKVERKLTKGQRRGQDSLSDQLKAYRLVCLIFEVKKTRKQMKGLLKSREFIHIFSQPPFRFSFLQNGYPSPREQLSSTKRRRCTMLTMTGTKNLLLSFSFSLELTVKHITIPKWNPNTTFQMSTIFKTFQTSNMERTCKSFKSISPLDCILTYRCSISSLSFGAEQEAY